VNVTRARAGGHSSRLVPVTAHPASQSETPAQGNRQAPSLSHTASTGARYSGIEVRSNYEPDSVAMSRALLKVLAWEPKGVCGARH
jgi:hypothetical protein